MFDSMTEDAAVFGGQKNMFAGLENARALYQPEMIAVSTILDDLQQVLAGAPPPWLARFMGKNAGLGRFVLAGGDE